jgi:hypothetical protein
MPRIPFPKRSKSAPARETHLHRCGDYDVCYSTEDPLLSDCRACRREAANARMVAEADPITRHPEGL